MAYHFRTMDSPIGVLTLIAGDKGLAAILWDGEPLSDCKFATAVEQPDHPVLKETARQLHDYFNGQLTKFTLPLDFQGTEFQRHVWQALLEIPFGETRSYGQIAAAIGYPKAVRAVGGANGRNPLPIVAPCHRVIGANGKLTGFGGGLKIKEFLLGHESAGQNPR